MNRLLYSHGEPAGIGIDLILHLSKSKFWQEMRSCLICIVDFELLKSRAKLLNLKIQFVEIKSLKLAKKISLERSNLFNLQIVKIYPQALLILKMQNMF